MTPPAPRRPAAVEPRAATADVPALAAGLVTVTLWGSAFVGIRAAGAAFSPGALALGRLLAACVVLGAVALVRREALPGRRDLLAIAAYGVLWLCVYSVALNEAERRVDAGTAAMLINIGPILIAVLAGVLLGEGFPRGLFAGCMVAFAGCVTIGFATSRSGARAGLGIVLCLVAALAYASAVVVQKPVLARVSPLQVTWLGCAAAALACLPFAPTLAREAAGAGANGIGWTVYLGVAPTATGFATWTFALRRTSAGRMGSMTYLVPPVAVLLGWALLGETPPGLAAAGGALCLGGVYLARRAATSPPASSRRRTAPATGSRRGTRRRWPAAGRWACRRR
jgi:drug/metabolite transporter (DMT)-like permease